MTLNNQINDALLKEILPLPAEEIISNRFAASHEAEAKCSGSCISGKCRTIA